MKKRKAFRLIALSLVVLFTAGYLLPRHFVMPVEGAGLKNFNPASFWAYPWGKSITHKGVDIFASSGTRVLSATVGWVVYTGCLERGGNAVIVLGPKWCFHYYVHLKRIDVARGSLVKGGTPIGLVGNTGNAAGKPPHLHYSISRLIPFPWMADRSIQGWKKMFYLDPAPFLGRVRV